jgi:hypothetical protein
MSLDVSTEELLSAEKAFTYLDLHAVLNSEDQNTIAWLTPHAAVMRESVVCYWIQLDTPCCFSFSVDGKDMIALARSAEHLSEICDVVLRLLAASVVHSVILDNFESLDGVWIRAPTLAYMIEQCRSLKAVTLRYLALDENHCRVLGAYSRPDLDIELHSCKLTIDGTSALAEILRGNQGPTKLEHCNIDYSVLADGLRGNRRLKSLRPYMLSRCAFLAIAGALKENKGLVDVNLSYHFKMSEVTWDAVCDSLKTHPTLEVLHLWPVWDASFASAAFKYRIQALVDMLKVNTSIHTISLDSRCSGHKRFRRLVIPYLETNRLRPRVRAIQQTRPITYRAKVLGRALMSARTDANRFWMLLSGNAEVAFPSATATATLAANTPTPAPVGTSENATTTGAANPGSTDGVHATSVATPASGQKRKVCPSS